MRERRGICLCLSARVTEGAGQVNTGPGRAQGGQRVVKGPDLAWEPPKERERRDKGVLRERAINRHTEEGLEKRSWTESERGPRAT